MKKGIHRIKSKAGRKKEQGEGVAEKLARLWAGRGADRKF